MKRNRKIVIAVVCVAVGLYLIKSSLGIDIFKKWTLGVYKANVGESLVLTPVVFAESEKVDLKENRIVVKFSKTVSKVNPKIFGHNFLGHVPRQKHKTKKFNNVNTDYGAGLWDGKWDKTFLEQPLKLAQDIGIKVVRFPGGCGTHVYDWKKAVGRKRKKFLFGVNEFLKVVDDLGAEVIFTVSYFTGNEVDAADLVEYFNADNDGSNPNGGIDWAAERSKNGREKLYGVKYFEIGNEVMYGNHQDISAVTPQEYAKRYLKYYDAMKAADPTIQIGAVLHTADWNKNVIDIIKDKIDFGIIHTYPTPVWGKQLETMSASVIFQSALARPIFKDESKYREVLALLKQHAGRDIPLAITEFNGGFAQDKPVPYRHTMGNALINAELLRIFMNPSNNILMANHWNFINEYWGMVANGFQGKYEDLNKPYYKRPNYYVFKMYHDHFGSSLVDVEVQSDVYDISNLDMFKHFIGSRVSEGVIQGGNLLSGAWVIKDFEGAEVNVIDDELEIKFIEPKTYNYYHSSQRVSVEPDTYYKLSGFIKTENLVDDKGVSLEVQDGRGWTKTHSASGTQRIIESNGWQYVEAIYKTLPDANAVSVIARRIGEIGPLKGKVYFKDVKLEKFIPDIDTKIPYLSVNASKSEDGSKVYLMVINKNLEEAMTSTIELKDFVPSAMGDAWVLNGPEVDSTNEIDRDNVKVTHIGFEIWSQESGEKNSFEYTFEPHSLTAIEIKRKIDK